MSEDVMLDVLVRNRQIRRIEFTYEFIAQLPFILAGGGPKVKMTTLLPEDLTILRIVPGQESVVLYSVSKTFGALPPESPIPNFALDFKEERIIVQH